jgi:hypothetical protein
MTSVLRVRAAGSMNSGSGATGGAGQLRKALTHRLVAMR